MAQLRQRPKRGGRPVAADSRSRGRSGPELLPLYDPLMALVSRRLLLVDSAANYVLGLPLLIEPDRTARVLGLPDPGNRFYARVLGGVLTGIATALAIEHRRPPDGLVGLGTGGAIAINLLGGGSVAAWLSAEPATKLPRRGRALLGLVAGGVVGLGALEARDVLRAPD